MEGLKLLRIAVLVLVGMAASSAYARMDTGKVRVTAACGGPACELPEIAAMTK
jgi:hypothetical protein